MSFMWKGQQVGIFTDLQREGAAESGKRISAPPKRLSPDPQGSR